MRTILALVLLAGCNGDPDAVQVELSPSVISSLDGTTEVSALVSSDTVPLANTSVTVTVVYTDRNGTAHDITPVSGTTDERGVFHGGIEGLTFDGAGTVTVEAGGASGEATFSVLDRTPPKVEILPPTADGKVGANLPFVVQVKVTDEIGVARVSFETGGASRSTVVSSGSTDTTLSFRTVVDGANGAMVQLHAIAEDLSGNIGVADALAVTIDPAITIVTPPGLTGTLLVDGTATQLASPKSIVFSAMDNHLYVADAAQSGACQPSCIWRIDATTGAIDATPVFVGQGSIEGLALDADSSNLFFTDRSNRTGRLTWNGTAYTGAVACSDAAQQKPQTPFHLVFDPTLGLLVADDNAQELVRVATCATNTVGTNFSVNGNFDTPRGVALGPTGEIFVSDQGRDRISQVDRTTGAVTTFSGQFNQPYGLEFLSTGTSPWANSLMVAGFGDHEIGSTSSAGAAAFLRTSPIDLTISGDSLFTVTAPANGIRGRLYKITGF